jgi:riboflavin synthase
VFTGLIENVAQIGSVSRTDAGVDLRIDSPYRDLQTGESISINGVCLTVLDFGDGWFTVAAMVMTISRTTVGDWRTGTRVNIERAMRADARLGGHIVQGHVDGVASVSRVRRVDDAILADLSLPEGLSRTLVLHGSVALDGVSLTVNALEGDKLQVALIDHTITHTTLNELVPGSRVNVETDVIGKYIERLTAPYLNR